MALVESYGFVLTRASVYCTSSRSRDPIPSALHSYRPFQGATSRMSRITCGLVAVSCLGFLIGCDVPEIDAPVASQDEVATPAGQGEEMASSPSNNEPPAHGTGKDEYTKYLTLSNEMNFSAWASGDNRVGKTTYVWATLTTESDYQDGKILFQIEQPDGTTTEWAALESSEIEEPGDPNFGITFTPEQAGRHRISFQVTPTGEGHSEKLVTGVIFDVS